MRSFKGAESEDAAARHRRRALENEAEKAAEATAQRADAGVAPGTDQPLPERTRAFYEGVYGYGLGAVRTHTGSGADEALSGTGSRALTSGAHVVLGAKASGRTLAHELAHVVQQGAGAPLRAGPGVVGPATGAPATQFDVAEEVPHPQAQAPGLTADQVDEAIRYNSRRMADPYVFAVIRDVVGVARFPAVVDADFVQGVARWQVMFGLMADGRLTEPTVARVVRELRAESKLVPALAKDADRVEFEAALTFNDALGVDSTTISIVQRLVHAPATGVWDDATVRAVMAYQKARAVHPDGMIGLATQRLLIGGLVVAARYDEVIHVVVDVQHFPTANLAAIVFDATVAGADAITTGVIGTGQPQTVRVGPSTFAAGYEHMIRIIGHELQHVRQRSGAAPILNQHVREFLAFAWEALDTGAPALAPADRVSHANIAVARWNAAPLADRAAHQAVRDRLDRLITAGGVGNF